MKIQLIVAAILGVFLVPYASFAVNQESGSESEEVLNSELIIRCQYQMGEFGKAGVDLCIKGENEARAALAGYPDELRDIVRRCTRVMSKVGWAKARQCSDMEIAARDALPAYSAKYPDIVELCTDKVGKYGHAQVKQCVDAQIAERDGTRD